MHYYLCPRCNFKIAEKKRLCTTCGYRLPKPESVDQSESGSGAAKRSNILSRFFGARVEESKSGESGQEKPALG